MLRRTKRAGGFWQGVTGAAKDGDPPETPAQAAARELLEETGLVPAGGVVSVSFASQFEVPADQWLDRETAEGPCEEKSASNAIQPTSGDQPALVRVIEHTFYALVAPDEAPCLSSEHDAFRWCGLDEALALLQYENNKEALLRCSAAIES